MYTQCTETCVLFELLFYFEYNTELESACYNFYLLVFTSCFYGTLFYCIGACSGTEAVKLNTYLVGEGIITYYQAVVTNQNLHFATFIFILFLILLSSCKHLEYN